jgi:hypothetical protein
MVLPLRLLQPTLPRDVAVACGVSSETRRARRGQVSSPLHHSVHSSTHHRRPVRRRSPRTSMGRTENRIASSGTRCNPATTAPVRFRRRYGLTKRGLLRGCILSIPSRISRSPWKTHAVERPTRFPISGLTSERRTLRHTRGPSYHPPSHRSHYHLILLQCRIDLTLRATARCSAHHRRS